MNLHIAAVQGLLILIDRVGAGAGSYTFKLGTTCLRHPASRVGCNLLLKIGIHSQILPQFRYHFCGENA